ncbi:hypothetical protein SAMN05660297_01100 [Natronincola peptidivorans]|uniref:Uncharacterized protein n=1 Tax=Natronincola peptidivorans TaxID=426128 RepID=A0A1I0AVR2_9FIRM|nr:hypothetical protein [Natronincola peptidivorans]SES98553.1 hypothetical protein SAMN05660297_01100 [Natronincola peptidivorans]
MKIASVLTTYSLLAVVFTAPVYGNSSWIWVTTSPRTILPICIAVTLLIETFGVAKLNYIADIKQVFVIITFANLLSFIAPYLVRGYRLYPLTGSIFAAFDRGPYYMILAGYLLLTLIIEIPAVYLLLKKYVENKKRLLITIAGVNILTTVLVAITERMISIGYYV